MSLDTYSSRSQVVTSPAEEVFSFFSDTAKVERYYTFATSEKKIPLVQQVTFSSDSIDVKVDGIGPHFKIDIIERESPTLIFYKFQESPLIKEMTVALQIREIGVGECSISLVVRVDFPFLLKRMYGEKMSFMLDEAVRQLANIPFKEFYESR